jgi:hypothetical protein
MASNICQAPPVHLASDDVASIIYQALAVGAAAGCEWRAAVIRDARRDYNDAIRLPAELKVETSEC